MNIVLIGAGNVATQLAKAFSGKGFTISQIYSRTEDNAKALVQSVQSAYITDLQLVRQDADAYFICIKDSALAEVVSLLPALKGLIVHTSGVTGMEALNRFENYGVFYPLQTVQKQVSIDFTQTPVCVEANNNDNLEVLNTLAGAISQQVYEVNSEQRLALHVAAVFCNNFTHYLLTQGAGIIQHAGLPLHLIQSIVTETFKKLDFTGNTDWKLLQTGPAKRGDEVTIEKHLDFLAYNEPELTILYKMLSESIRKQYS